MSEDNVNPSTISKRKRKEEDEKKKEFKREVIRSFGSMETFKIHMENKKIYQNLGMEQNNTPIFTQNTSSNHLEQTRIPENIEVEAPVVEITEEERIFKEFIDKLGTDTQFQKEKFHLSSKILEFDHWPSLLKLDSYYSHTSWMEMEKYQKLVHKDSKYTIADIATLVSRWGAKHPMSKEAQKEMEEIFEVILDQKLPNLFVNEFVDSRIVQLAVCHCNCHIYTNFLEDKFYFWRIPEELKKCSSCGESTFKTNIVSKKDEPIKIEKGVPICPSCCLQVKNWDSKKFMLIDVNFDHSCPQCQSKDNFYQ